MGLHLNVLVACGNVDFFLARVDATSHTCCASHTTPRISWHPNPNCLVFLLTRLLSDLPFKKSKNRARSPASYHGPILCTATPAPAPLWEMMGITGNQCCFSLFLGYDSAIKPIPQPTGPQTLALQENHREDSLKHRFLGSGPRVSDSVCLEWVQEFTFLTNFQCCLSRTYTLGIWAIGHCGICPELYCKTNGDKHDHLKWITYFSLKWLQICFTVYQIRASYFLSSVDFSFIVSISR